MSFYFEGEFQCKLEVYDAKEARQLLRDWARLTFTPNQLQFCYQLIEEYVGATIDDLTIEDDGSYLINGKTIASI